MSIRLGGSGNFNNLEKFLMKMVKNDFRATLEQYGKEGVAALSGATPVDTGVTADSWSYEIIDDGQTTTLQWLNSSEISTGTPIVILLQYGHGTGTGHYVEGYDFINPSIRPVFDSFINKIWNEVTTA